MHDPTTWQVIWFLLICILWTGFLVLEGFDFGVGMLIRAVGRTDAEKRAVIHTIGPVWDGNEVWLLTAGGAMFAAFPNWYATMFSGFYLALFLMLAGLIARGVSFEFWHKRDDAGWKRTWEWAMIVGSAVPALLVGVAWANIVRGVPLDLKGDFNGTLFTLLNPYSLMGGVATLTLFLSHGAIFLRLRTTGVLEQRAGALVKTLAPVAAAAVAVFALWTLIRQANGAGIEVASAILCAAAVLCAVSAMWRAVDRPGSAFALSAGTIATLFAALFVELYPNAIVSSGPGRSLSLFAASSTPYTLKVMTVVAVVMVPIVLAYQAWTYWVFRARIGAEDFEGVRTPLDLIGRHAEEDQPTAPAGSPS